MHRADLMRPACRTLPLRHDRLLQRNRSSAWLCMQNWPKQTYSSLNRHYHQESASEKTAVRGKQLKEEFKAKHRDAQWQKIQSTLPEQQARLSRWELTVGLEIHAQLNTERKLFSESMTSSDEDPNTNVTYYDLAFPGTQPVFQAPTVLPALRAAIALQCQIQTESRFDRKHYFYPDQPAGYQITQYYRPFAVNGQIDLHDVDGLDLSEAPVSIGIKQIQLEQDTAKSISQMPSTTLIDFNRVGHPLIEIITLPHLHSAQAAAACARKILSVLQAVNAVSTGMEMGGLRADVNVSVTPKGSTALGQRTEIKNVSSFKAIEQAVIAERDRQIEVLESGGVVLGETRGWTLGESQTTRLRGKEGEVDYRYMPDPDIPPLFIDQHLIDHLRQTLPPLPDDIAANLVSHSGLSIKDARTLLTLDDGQRLGYFDDVCDAWTEIDSELTRDMTRSAGNWVIHELGGLLSASSTAFNADIVTPEILATILSKLHHKNITGTSAKRLLAIVFEGSNKSIDSIIEEEHFAVKQLTDYQYLEMAKVAVQKNPDQVKAIKKGQLGKIKFLVGQIMRMSSGTAEAPRAENAIREVLNLETNEG